ncbi:unnamed protein product, partial [Mesorhabditis belari]|uniref:Phosphatidate cytidylyltransferase, mitochondrial n=1 Tax=Mesorhabditis belari TaxID=2138241 RepID=A0AAF3J5F8_9BILA
MEEQRQKYGELLQQLPLETVDYAFAYGSGALQQKGEKKEEKMVDFILSTSEPEKFHRVNLERNGHHYSLLRIAGPRVISQFQTTFGAHVYFNTQVLVGQRTIKYGIISTQDLKTDLLDWKWLAGRLQKPVLEIISQRDDIAGWIKANRLNALNAALLQLHETFSLRDLFRKIVELSYMGDFRMLIGEDKNKVAKIVDGSYGELAETYRYLLSEDKRIFVKSDAVIRQEYSQNSIADRINHLPANVKGRLSSSYQKEAQSIDPNDLTRQLSSAIGSVVAPVALVQTAKNAVSAGILRSIIYSMAKMKKMLKSVR